MRDGVKFSVRDYSYEILTAKPDMRVTNVDDSVPYRPAREARKEIVARDRKCEENRPDERKRQCRGARGRHGRRGDLERERAAARAGQAVFCECAGDAESR